MRLSNVKVEQISINSVVVEDYGEILSKSELQSIILSAFPNSTLNENGYIYGASNGKDYCIYYKNISYLGIPHPIFKKRIQISSEFAQLYRENTAKNIVTLLIGVYSYKGTVIFTDFDTKTYITKKAHNSSAHVYTIDLKNANLLGIVQKEDHFGNLITSFDKSKIEDYLKYKFANDTSVFPDFISEFDDFFENINKDWNGIDCYNEMFKDNYRNKGQAEWAGYYLEYRFEKYLENNIIKDIEFCQDKSKNGVDLDLYIKSANSYGDLKTHSIDSGAILGNDWSTIQNIVEKGQIYYIVCNHDTIKDKDKNYAVTLFWNTTLNKENKYSYGEKMKHSVKLKDYIILEINKYNFKYLSVYRQGHNSNGNPRLPKIKINKKDIDNFLVHQMTFNS